jgi:hypothetical protein
MLLCQTGVTSTALVRHVRIQVKLAITTSANGVSVVTNVLLLCIFIFTVIRITFFIVHDMTSFIVAGAHFGVIPPGI